MLASIVILAVAHLWAQPAAISKALKSDVRPQESPSQVRSEDITQLQAQAEGGNAAAQLKLAQAYESGVGTPKNDQLAAQWCRRAAEQGNSEAQDILGAKYLIGSGVEQSKEEAVKWFRKSARQSNANAMYHLGVAYYNGDGVALDDSLSYAWFVLAGEAGSQSAQEATKRGESELKPDRVDRAFEKIAEMYEKGGSLPENQAEAIRWWSRAAARGAQDAQAGFGLALVSGQGAPADLAKGRHLCNQAAKVNDHRAEYCMGYIYQHGLGVTLDAKKARFWYGLAASKGEIGAIRSLALMEATGDGGKIDRSGAFLLYAKLAETGDQEALHSLAKLRSEITPKEWELLQNPLIRLRIDPSKLDLVLRQINAN
jgi:TPR repeat protein